MSWIITPQQKYPVSPFLLDTYPGAAAAYSLRQLHTGVTNVVRVRRSSDNAELDFTAAQVTNGTLAGWVGAGNNGFVRTWYDQSGNAQNAGNSTTAEQPQIVSGGVLITDNSKPCLQFNGSSTSLNANALASVFTGTGVILSAATVYKTSQLSPASIATSWGFGSSVSQNPLRWLGQQASSTAARFDERDDATSGLALNVAGGSIASQSLAWVNSNTTTQVLRINGAQTATTTGLNGLITLDRFAIGCLHRQSKNSFWNGNIQEIIIYQANKAADAAAIESNINGHYAIY